MRSYRSIVCMAACLCLSAVAAPQPAAHAPPNNSPVGHWVTEHTSSTGMGSWWDFRPDGTLTVYFGAMVTNPITRSADTLNMPSGTAGSPPVHVKFRVDGTKLHLTANGTESTYTRVGSAPSEADPLLGQWKPDPPKTPSTEANAAEVEKARADALFVFKADSTESIRIPFGSRDGTWDARSHTFRFQKEAVAYSFATSGAKLVLGQPPGGKKTETYLRDTLFH